MNEKTLRAWLERDDLTIDVLVDQAESLLGDIAPVQTRYKVRERPDVRTIRYYVSQNLLPKAVGYQGGRAHYGGQHLLRLLLIKRLQAEHWTLQKIAASLEGLDDDQIIERLLAAAPATAQERVRPRRRAPARTRASTSRASSSADAFSPSAHARVALVHGAALEAPASLMQDATQRNELATRLESLAAWLRAAPGKEEEA